MLLNNSLLLNEQIQSKYRSVCWTTLYTLSEVGVYSIIVCLILHSPNSLNSWWNLYQGYDGIRQTFLTSKQFQNEEITQLSLPLLHSKHSLRLSAVDNEMKILSFWKSQLLILVYEYVSIYITMAVSLSSKIASPWEKSYFFLLN